ncbi:MAG: GEVED domain-containing protein, partial [Saprospiraceae bacterium]
WSNGATTNMLTNLGPGTYIVTVTDANGCTAVGSQRIEFENVTDCLARGSNTRFEWIQRIQIDQFIHNSDNNGGYADFRQLNIPLRRGATHTVILTPGYLSVAFQEYWRIWIDFNRDGDFMDAEEEVLIADGVVNDLTANIRIPINAAIGTTRMRIAMRYGAPTGACGIFPYGEVEDYTKTIHSNTNINDLATGRSTMNALSGVLPIPANLQLYPNTTKKQVWLHYEATQAGVLQLSIHNSQGQALQQATYALHQGKNTFELALEALPAGTYLLRGTTGTQQFSKQLIISE